MRPAGSRYLWSDGKWVETDLVPITVAADQGDFFRATPFQLQVVVAQQFKVSTSRLCSLFKQLIREQLREARL